MVGDRLRAGLTVSTRNGYYSGQSQQEKSVATAAYDLNDRCPKALMPLNTAFASASSRTAPLRALRPIRISFGLARRTPHLEAQGQHAGSSTSSVYVAGCLA